MIVHLLQSLTELAQSPALDLTLRFILNGNTHSVLIYPMTILIGLLLPYGMAFLTSLGIYLGSYWTFLGLFVIFVVHPILDLLTRKRICFTTKNSIGFDLNIYLTVILLTVFLIANSVLAQNFDGIAWWGAALSVGSMMGVIGITTAHELVHRPSPIKFFGWWLLSMVNFTHWGAEHVESHHKWVGTTQDSATALKDESLYHFWYRDYFHGLIGNFRREIHTRQWKNNRYWLYGAIKLSWLFFFYKLGGPPAILFWFVQSMIAILLLLSVDYLEHYGLQREVNQPVQAHHSWDSYTPFTNFALIKLGYHAHHHLKPRVPYPELAPHPQARRLPFGYSTMVILALMPWLFFKIMNPLLPKKEFSIPNVPK